MCARTYRCGFSSVFILLGRRQMAVVEAVGSFIGRELDTVEKELLQFLTPQGVAKVNSELTKGIVFARCRPCRPKA